jgi:ribosome-associated protein
MSDYSDDFEQEFEEEKSKSQVKREMAALRDLGEQITLLPKRELAQIPLSVELSEQVDKIRRMQHREARRREIRYLAKLMDQEDLSDVHAAMEQIAAGNKAKARAFQELETMRDELVAGNNALIEEIISRFPDCDRQHLRQLARNAQREFSANKPPTQQRKLFRYLRELSEA